MRVLHLITRLIVGGAQENTLASVLGLRSKPGFDVRLLSGPTSGPEGSLQSQAERIPGLLTLVPSLVRPIDPFRDTLTFFVLKRTFVRDRPDLVHTHSGKAGLLGRLAARAARVPFIVHTIHGPSFGPFQGPVPNAAFRSAERIAGRFTSHFVVVANAMAQQYLAAGIGRPDQFTRIWSGFDLEPFLLPRDALAIRAKLGLSPEHVVIGKIARLFALKGHDDLIEVAAVLTPTHPQLRFLLVGDGSWRSRIETEIARRGLSRFFVFTGLVPPTEIPELLCAVDMLVHLSRREGLARALPQAMAAGRPILAYDCDGAREVCLENRTGYLIQPGDLHTLAEHIRRLAADPAKRDILGTGGRRLACENFSVEKMVEDLAALYERLFRGFEVGRKGRNPSAGQHAR